jgi:hypothetical protein
MIIPKMTINRQIQHGFTPVFGGHPNGPHMANFVGVGQQ